MSVIGSPTNRSPQRAFALQKYLILHSQHDALQKHLNNLTSTSTSASPSPSGSLSSSPEQSSDRHFRHHHRSSTISPIPEMGVSPMARPILQKRRSSLPSELEAPSVSREQSEILEDEQKLLQINQQIKSTLTELLNCESVKGDKQYRAWVQSRLMDAEMELKTGKAASVGRRKSIDFAV